MTILEVEGSVTRFRGNGTAWAVQGSTMPGEAINLANILTRVQFAQDAYAIFQATDQSAREELGARQKVRAVQAEPEIQESEHLEGKTVHKIAEDQQRGRNFDEMLDEARKRRNISTPGKRRVSKHQRTATASIS